MRIPAYDDLRVGLNQLPTPTMRSGEVQDTASRQITAAGQGLQRAGQDLTKHVLELQQEVNDTMLMGRLNLIKGHAIELEHNQQTGFRMLKGDQALTRPDNMALEDEYGNALQKFIEQQGEGLAPAVLSRYREQAGNMVNGLRERAMVHRNGEYANYRAKQYEAIIGTASREIAINPGDEKVLEGAASRIGSTIERMAALAGHPPEWVEVTKRTAMSGALKGAIVQLMDDDPHKAQAFLEKHLDKMDFQDAAALRGQLKDAAAQVDGERMGAEIFKGAGPVGADFESIFQHTLKIEGGYVADDAGKGETNLGINKTANPDLNIKGMTVSKAREVYRQRYWNAIGGDSLPPQVRAIAFDAAVNHGPSFANKIIAQADGDPAKMIALRRAEYARLVRSNPGKYGKYAKSWESRLKSLEGGGRRSRADMLAEADQIKDPRGRRAAQDKIVQLDEREKLAKSEEYSHLLATAWQQRGQGAAGHLDIQKSVFNGLTAEDQKKIIEGPARADDPQLMLALMNPENLNPQFLMDNRYRMTEETFQRKMEQATKLDVRKATIDNEVFNAELDAAGMFSMRTSSNSNDKQSLVKLRDVYESEIDAQQRKERRELTRDEKRSLLRQLIKPVRERYTREGIFGGARKVDVSKRAYQVENPGNIMIPQTELNKILVKLKENGIPPTLQNIVAAYLQGKGKNNG
ncbi:MAG: hypothetical protein GXY45_11855 [Ramlibacter sp.]|nr:hypothetical protein [Ramlibacter sp.]